MANLKTILIIALVILSMIFSVSCTQKEIVQPSDELVENIWQNRDNFGKEIKLEFDNNNAELSIKTENFSTKISGVAIIDNSTIQITDDTLSKSFCFNYNLYGNKIDLIYNDKTVILNKVYIQN